MLAFSEVRGQAFCLKVRKRETASKTFLNSNPSPHSYTSFTSHSPILQLPKDSLLAIPLTMPKDTIQLIINPANGSVSEPVQAYAKPMERTLDALLQRPSRLDKSVVLLCRP